MRSVSEGPEGEKARRQEGEKQVQERRDGRAERASGARLLSLPLPSLLAFWPLSPSSLLLVQRSKLPAQPLPLRLRSRQRRLHRRELGLQQRLFLREQVIHAGDL